MLAGSVCDPDLDTDCHARPELAERVVELLAMTVVHFDRVREHYLFRQHDGIDGQSPPQDCVQRLWVVHLTLSLIGRENCNRIKQVVERVLYC